MNLYHYTNQIGFMGIVQNKELWATQIQFLNDKNEYKLATKIAHETINEMLNEEGLPKKNKKLLLDFQCGLKRIKNTNMCVCSLTENGDLLSQWRGYANSHGSFSVGFDKESIESSLESSDLFLKKCIYDKNEQVKIIKDIITESLFECKDFENEEDEITDIYNDSAIYFSEKISSISPIIKDRSFSEEAEWRIYGKISFADLSYRPGRSMLIPFYKIKFQKSLMEMIGEIIVGHTPNKDLAILATESFMVNQYLPDEDDDDYTCPFKVKASTIPFMSW